MARGSQIELNESQSERDNSWGPRGVYKCNKTPNPPVWGKNQVFYQGYTGEMRLSLRLGLSATSRRKPTELLQYHSGRCRKVVFMSGVNLIHVFPTPRTCILCDISPYWREVISKILFCPTIMLPRTSTIGCF